MVAAPPLSIKLTTSRLVLRAPRTGDVAEIRRLLRANEEHLRPWSPLPVSSDDPASITEISKTVLRQRRDWKRGSAYVFMVASRDEPARFLGKVALTGILRGAFHGAYLGYWMDAKHQSRGLASEAIGAVVEFAFGAAGLHRVQAAIMPRNDRSLRVAEKVGFRREGYAERYLQIAGKWEDHVLFALTREERA